MKADAHNIAAVMASQVLVMMNRRAIDSDMNRIDVYSAKKIITNGAEANSVLKPLTSSDSPSEKSKGERFVSARATIKKRIIWRKRKRERQVIILSVIS